MKEEFLHFLWKYQLFSKKQLQTQNKESINVLFNGNLNRLEGPDFLNAKIEINQQVWVGNIELHLKSSDWYLHQHENDKNYDTVILHVVWENDAEVFGKNNVPLPTLELKPLVSKNILSQYDGLLYSKQSWIPCENQIQSIDVFTLHKWLERLFMERLESKANQINLLLEKSENDWEAVLFSLLAKNFGLKVNGETFLQWSQSFSFFCS